MHSESFEIENLSDQRYFKFPPLGNSMGVLKFVFTFGAEDSWEIITHLYPLRTSIFLMGADISVTATSSKSGSIWAVTAPSPAPMSSRRPCACSPSRRRTCCLEKTNIEPRPKNLKQAKITAKTGKTVGEK